MKTKTTMRQEHIEDLRGSERFWRRVQPNDDGCWEWVGRKNSDGYGRYAIGRGPRGQHTTFHEGAHRITWRMVNGDFPEGTEASHLCGNRWCCNPDHVVAESHKDNLYRGANRVLEVAAENREKTYCPQGHPYSAQNTYVSKRGTRHCRECQRLRQAKRVVPVHYHRDRWRAKHWPDGIPKGRTKIHCKRGHELDETVYINPTSGARVCRSCERERSRQRREKNALNCSR